MGFDWSRYLVVSQQLLSACDSKDAGLDEARRRSSISRAYYSIFCRVRDYLKSTGVCIPHRNVHEVVRSELDNTGDADHIKMAANLKRMSKNRNEADYDSPVTIGVTAAQSQMMLAQDTDKILKSKIAPPMPPPPSAPAKP